jgi:hypothetical protein
MPLSATSFFAQLKKIKAYLGENPGASAELQQAFGQLAASFKAEFTAEEFKQALAEDRLVSSNLEERVTSAMMILNRERAQKAGG